MLRRRPGFTLIEVLIYTAFVALILTSVTLLATVAFTSQSRLRSALILKENIRYALMQIAASVAEASNITTPASGTTSSTIVLSMASSTQNPTTFRLSNGSITMAQGTGTAMALISDEVLITTFSAVRVSSTTPNLRIVISGALRGAAPGYPTLTVTTTAAVHR